MDLFPGKELSTKGGMTLKHKNLSPEDVKFMTNALQFLFEENLIFGVLERDDQTINFDFVGKGNNLNEPFKLSDIINNENKKKDEFWYFDGSLMSYRSLEQKIMKGKEKYLDEKKYFKGRDVNMTLYFINEIYNTYMEGPKSFEYYRNNMFRPLKVDNSYVVSQLNNNQLKLLNFLNNFFADNTSDNNSAMFKFLDNFNIYDQSGYLNIISNIRLLLEQLQFDVTEDNLGTKFRKSLQISINRRMNDLEKQVFILGNLQRNFKEKLQLVKKENPKKVQQQQQQQSPTQSEEDDNDRKEEPELVYSPKTIEELDEFLNLQLFSEVPKLKIDNLDREAIFKFLDRNNKIPQEYVDEMLVFLNKKRERDEGEIDQSWREEEEEQQQQPPKKINKPNQIIGGQFEIKEAKQDSSIPQEIARIFGI